MTEGIVWLTLLAVFAVLARLGWVDYRKVETYGQWAQQFERAKYDIYGVLGQTDQTLTWGVPTRKGPINIDSCTFAEVQRVSLSLNGQRVDWQHPPSKARNIAILLEFMTERQPVQLPFTEMALAIDWVKYLEQALQNGANVAKT
ncbi:MAG: hypothetical protein HC934_11780 [Acaryochloridaceae cyanobacterium SU_2_1]|nr:hypothetical protein [Acaryochloridaceae cyanobacterium SU_2_1]